MAEKVLANERFCDFCGGEPYMKWWFSQFTIPAGTDIDFAFEMMEHPEWFACMECHVMLLARDTDGLVTRAINHGEVANEDKEKVRNYLTKVYASLVQKRSE